MHNNSVGNRLNNSGNFEVTSFSPEDFGFNGEKNEGFERVEGGYAGFENREIGNDGQTLDMVKADSSDSYAELKEKAKGAIDADNSSSSKEMGSEYQRLVLKTIDKDVSDPAILNDEFDELSRGLIAGLFRREVGRGK